MSQCEKTCHKMRDNPSHAGDKLKVKIIGLYGLPGAGKTRLLRQLPASLGENCFGYYEGSEVISSIVPGGLKSFKQAEDSLKYEYRCESINFIRDECVNSNKVGIVTGHFIFWNDTQAEQKMVLTDNDLRTYSFIIYLRTEPNVIAQRRYGDDSRDRQQLPVEVLEKWQAKELNLLRKICRQRKILFSVVSEEQPLTKIVNLIKYYYHNDENINISIAKQMIDDAVNAYASIETMLVVDADKTLSSDDASAMFWDVAGYSYPLKAVFDSPLKYSYEAFQQVTLLLEEAANETKFEMVCEETASRVKIHEEILALLSRAMSTKYTSVVVVTSGVRRIWEKVLKKHHLEKIPVIGGGRISDGIVVSGEVKANLVTHLRATHKMYVCAIGDSPLDLSMLKEANLAIVVVGPKESRSRSMTSKLQEAINEGLQAKQVLLPEISTNKRDCDPLPVIKLTDENFLSLIFCPRVHLVTAPEGASKLLQTPTRNANVSGVLLRAAHQEIGKYLTIHAVSQILGLEEYDIPHVQGKPTIGYRIAGETSTVIIALMRAGEPMAFGVNDAMPSAMFHHAKKLSDIKDHDLEGRATIVLVDGVINTGKTVFDFIVGLRKKSTARIIVVTGVAQHEAVCEVGSQRAHLAKALSHIEGVSIVALRLSPNKYAGSGTTDTGNRLFNTPHIL